ncbi:hypothetical protein [Treponema putidum]|uniref:hypothetical protein n=1 Tax=Treponema putidum TaxID=221027 RepID=UPI0021058A0B|nr:hypothetical protein [Treponema putidum]
MTKKAAPKLFFLLQDDVIMEWVLAQGANVLPIEPKVFAADWKNQIKQMAERADIL